MRLARAIAALCLANARSSMTAPMKFEKSVTSPIVIGLDLGDELVLASSSTPTAATYAREAAEHFWPWNSKAPRISAVRSTSGSADGWATTKSLPPVSPTMRG